MERPTVRYLEPASKKGTAWLKPENGLGNSVVCWKLPQSGPPLFIEAVAQKLRDLDTALEWISSCRSELDRLCLVHGGVVLRGFPLQTAEDFNRVVCLFPSFDRGYVGGGGPRKAITGKVMEATQMDERFKISLHSEMSYLRDYPKRVIFFSRQPAAVGGATIIGNVNEVMRQLPPRLRNKLESEGTRIVRNFAPAGSTGKDGVVSDHPDKRGWDLVFGTSDRDKVQKVLTSLDMTPMWHDDGSLTTFSKLEAFAPHAITGEMYYRTFIHLNSEVSGKVDANSDLAAIAAAIRAKQKYPSGTFLGNGEPLAEEDAHTIKDIYQSIERSWIWRAGDVMMLDNLQTAHGREPYSGPRDVQVALLDW